MNENNANQSLVGPLLLILAGVIFLLNNLGWIDWDIWSALARLWPVILIVIGLDLILGRRSRAGAALVAVLSIFLLLGGLWFLDGNRPMAVNSAQAVTVNQALEGAVTARVLVAPGAARLRLTGGAGSGMLVEGAVQPRRGERVTPDFSVQEGRGHFELATQGNGVRVVIPGVVGREGMWDLALNGEIPTDLTVSTGVGEATLDLRRTVLTSLTVNTGVGRTEVTLPASGDYSVAIDGGIGSLIVWTPPGVGVRLTAQTGIGSLDLPETYRQSGDAYESPNYQNAEERIHLVVDGGIGNIQVAERRAE